MDGVLGSSWGIVHIGKSTCTALRYASGLWEVRYA